MLFNLNEFIELTKTSNTHTSAIEGAIFNTKQGPCAITQYINSSNVKVKFLASGGETTCRMSNLRSGRVADPLFRGVYGVGYLDNMPTVDKNGNLNHYYVAWKGMIARYQRSLNRGSNNITVSEEWFSLKKFSEWYEVEAAPFYEAGINPEVDSDLYALIHNKNKHYSATSCVLLTKTLNVMLASLKKQLSLIQHFKENGGRLPAGIQYEKSRKRFHLKVFKKHYKTFKIKDLPLALDELRSIRIKRFLEQAQLDIGVLSDNAILLMNEIR
jgi:hypothetical protein